MSTASEIISNNSDIGEKNDKITSANVMEKALAGPSAFDPSPACVLGSESLDCFATNKKKEKTLKVNLPIESPGLGDVRNTLEYKTAWDVELWKAVQISRFKKQLEEQKQKALSDLKRSIEIKAQKAHRALTEQKKGFLSSEKTLAESKKELEDKKSRLAQTERDLKITRDRLLEAQKRVEDDVRAQIVRLNEDMAHRTRLHQERLKNAEEKATLAEEKLKRVERDYHDLHEELQRLRAQKAITAVSTVDEHTTALQAKMRIQFCEEQRLLQDRLEQRFRSDMMEVTRRCRDLEDQNIRLTSALARRREQVRQLRRDLEKSKALKYSTNKYLEMQENGKGSTPGDKEEILLPNSTSSKVLVDAAKELQRLQSERWALVEGSAGALTEEDPLIKRIDAMIDRLEKEFPTLKRIHHCGPFPSLEINF